MEVTVVPWYTVVVAMTWLSRAVQSENITTQSGIETICSSPNVRTVIFRRTDMDRECWSREEIALLFTRRMMQELLPKRKPTSVLFLLDYFKECLETVKQLATSRETHTLVVTALADSLGGYLQAFGLPMARQAYYEGILGYEGAKQLHELQDAFKKLLRTNGGGWTKPTAIRKSSHVQPLRVGKAPAGCDPCDSLVLKNELYRGDKGQGIAILMPFLDDPSFPSSIALPFKDKSLYSLTSRSSSNILIKYYSRTLWCLTQSYGTSVMRCEGCSVPQVKTFFTEFLDWLSSDVMKRLTDPTLYAAFGSVLRIVETLNRTKSNRPCRLDRLPTIVECSSSDESEDTNVTPRTFYIVVILSLVIAFWIIVFIVYIAYKWFMTRKQHHPGCLTDSDYNSSEDDILSCQQPPDVEACKNKDTKKDCEPTSAPEICTDISEKAEGTSCTSSAPSETTNRGKSKKKKKKKTKKKDVYKTKKKKLCDTNKT